MLGVVVDGLANCTTKDLTTETGTGKRTSERASDAASAPTEECGEAHAQCDALCPLAEVLLSLPAFSDLYLSVNTTLILQLLLSALVDLFANESQLLQNRDLFDKFKSRSSSILLNLLAES